VTGITFRREALRPMARSARRNSRPNPSRELEHVSGAYADRRRSDNNVTPTFRGVVGLVLGAIFASRGRIFLLMVAHAAFDPTALAIVC
jgi:hypothetical protein